MSLRNVRLLFRREVLDQCRDRRTLTMIFVVPLLLYPALGAVFFQLTQFTGEHVNSVRFLYLDENHRDENTIPSHGAASDVGSVERARIDRQRKFEGEIDDPQNYRFEFSGVSSDDADATARRLVTQKTCDAVVVLPSDFFESGDVMRTSSPPDISCLENSGNRVRTDPENEFLPPVRIYYSTAFEKSVLAKRRLEHTLRQWSISLGKETLHHRGFDVRLLDPLHADVTDVAEHSRFRGASFWSKLLPIMLMLWALTGAFYPAVDLCAGEKERGTLETLLCSPASRGEIVLGKLLTIMCFSIATSVLNVAALGATASVLVSHFVPETTVSRFAIAGMLVALVPTSLIFSALAIALASHAKSTREGQYYLLPLIMVVMPLILVATMPGGELTLGTALIPVTGISLSLRRLLEGDVATVLRYSPVVVAVTLLCCFFSLRLAIRQFHSESVLFGGSGKIHPGLLLRNMFGKTPESPGTTCALTFACVLLALRYFSSALFTKQETFGDLFVFSFCNQFFFVALPAALFAAAFAKRPVAALGLCVRRSADSREPNFRNIIFGIAAALSFYPATGLLHLFVTRLYPIHESLLPEFEHLQELMNSGPLPLAILCIAVFPGFCEEIAFRGFLLGGLLPKSSTDGGDVDFSRNGRAFDAIFLSSFFFGVIHGIVQQSLTAAAIGCVLAVIAVRCRTILPCIAYHTTHNTLALLSGRFSGENMIQAMSNVPIVVLGTGLGVCLVAAMRASHVRKTETTPG